MGWRGVSRLMYNFSKEEWELILKMGFIEKGNNKNLAAEGIYYGGEKIVFEKLPPHQILPFNIDEIIAAGFNTLSDNIIKLKNAMQVACAIKEALLEKKGYSIIRWGDGELVFLAHDVILSSHTINSDARFNFLYYAGVDLPEHASRDLLTKEALTANIIGIPQARYPTFQCLFNRLAKHYQWDLKSLPFASSNINYELNDFTNIYHEVLSDYKVLLIGNRMEEGKDYFEKLGYKTIVGVLPVNGVKDVAIVIEKAKQFEYDVALVSAGIAANFICLALAQDGKIAIDFGHLIDQLLAETSPFSSLSNNSSQEIYCKAGDYYFEREDHKTAICYYEKTLEIQQIDAYIHLKLCQCYWELGDYEKCYHHNELAGKCNPEDSSVLFNREFFNNYFKKNNIQIAASKNHLISVILPVYNSETFLKETIQSILNQTEKDFELIIINDGSTDKSQEIIFSFDDNRIKYIKQENKGKSAAKNVGLEYASGKFITFHDSDDISLPSRFKMLIEGFYSQDIGFVHSDMLLINEKNHPIGYWQTKNINPDNVFSFFINVGTPYNNGSIMFRKNILWKNIFDQSLEIGEDTDFIMRIACDIPSNHISQPLYLYRRHQNNSSKEYSYEALAIHVRKYLNEVNLKKFILELDWEKQNINKDLLKAKLIVALALSRRWMMVDTIKMFDEAIPLVKDEEDRQFFEGMKSLVEANYERAANIFGSFINKDHIIYNYLGEALVFLEKYNDAYVHFLKALDLRPGYYTPVQNLKSLGVLKSHNLIDKIL